MRWTSLYRDPTYTTAPPYGPGPSPTLYREILMLNPRHLQENLYGLNPSVVLRMTLSPHQLQPLPPNKGFRCFLHRLWAAYPRVVECIQGAAFYSCNCWNHTPTNRQTDRRTYTGGVDACCCLTNVTCRHCHSVVGFSHFSWFYRRFWFVFCVSVPGQDVPYAATARLCVRIKRFTARHKPWT